MDQPAPGSRTAVRQEAKKGARVARCRGAQGSADPGRRGAEDQRVSSSAGRVSPCSAPADTVVLSIRPARFRPLRWLRRPGALARKRPERSAACIVAHHRCTAVSGPPRGGPSCARLARESRLSLWHSRRSPGVLRDPKLVESPTEPEVVRLAGTPTCKQMAIVSEPEEQKEFASKNPSDESSWFSWPW